MSKVSLPVVETGPRASEARARIRRDREMVRPGGVGPPPARLEGESRDPPGRTREPFGVSEGLESWEGVAPSRAVLQTAIRTREPRRGAPGDWLRSQPESKPELRSGPRRRPHRRSAGAP